MNNLKDLLHYQIASIEKTLFTIDQQLDDDNSESIEKLVNMIGKSIFQLLEKFEKKAIKRLSKNQSQSNTKYLNHKKTRKLQPTGYFSRCKALTSNDLSNQFHTNTDDSQSKVLDQIDEKSIKKADNSISDTHSDDSLEGDTTNFHQLNDKKRRKDTKQLLRRGVLDESFIDSEEEFQKKVTLYLSESENAADLKLNLERFSERSGTEISTKLLDDVRDYDENLSQFMRPYLSGFTLQTIRETHKKEESLSDNLSDVSSDHSYHPEIFYVDSDDLKEIRVHESL